MKKNINIVVMIGIITLISGQLQDSQAMQEKPAEKQKKEQPHFMALRNTLVNSSHLIDSIVTSMPTIDKKILFFRLPGNASLKSSIDDLVTHLDLAGEVTYQQNLILKKGLVDKTTNKNNKKEIEDARKLIHLNLIFFLNKYIEIQKRFIDYQTTDKNDFLSKNNFIYSTDEIERIRYILNTTRKIFLDSNSFTIYLNNLLGLKQSLYDTYQARKTSDSDDRIFITDNTDQNIPVHDLLTNFRRKEDTTSEKQETKIKINIARAYTSIQYERAKFDHGLKKEHPRYTNVNFSKIDKAIRLIDHDYLKIISTDRSLHDAYNQLFVYFTSALYTNLKNLSALIDGIIPHALFYIKDIKEEDNIHNLPGRKNLQSSINYFILHLKLASQNNLIVDDYIYNKFERKKNKDLIDNAIRSISSNLQNFLDKYIEIQTLFIVYQQNNHNPFLSKDNFIYSATQILKIKSILNTTQKTFFSDKLDEISFTKLNKPDEISFTKRYEIYFGKLNELKRLLYDTYQARQESDSGENIFITDNKFKDILINDPLIGLLPEAKGPALSLSKTQSSTFFTKNLSAKKAQPPPSPSKPPWYKKRELQYTIIAGLSLVTIIKSRKLLEARDKPVLVAVEQALTAAASVLTNAIPEPATKFLKRIVKGAIAGARATRIPSIITTIRRPKMPPISRKTLIVGITLGTVVGMIGAFAAKAKSSSKSTKGA